MADPSLTDGMPTTYGDAMQTIAEQPLPQELPEVPEGLGDTVSKALETMKIVAPEPPPNEPITQEQPPAAPRPSGFDRASLHMRKQFWTEMLAGQGLYTVVNKMAQNDVGFAKSYKAWIDDEIMKWDLMPNAQGFSENAAAIIGGFLGAIPSPENLVPVPGLGKVVAGGANIGTRTLAAGTSAAAMNLASDPFVQAMQVYNGLQDRMDWVRTALSVPLGFAIGSGAHLMLREGPAVLVHELVGAKRAATAEVGRILDADRSKAEPPPSIGTYSGADVAMPVPVRSADDVALAAALPEKPPPAPEAPAVASAVEIPEPRPATHVPSPQTVQAEANVAAVKALESTAPIKEPSDSKPDSWFQDKSWKTDDLRPLDEKAALYVNDPNVFEAPNGRLVRVDPETGERFAVTLTSTKSASRDEGSVGRDVEERAPFNVRTVEDAHAAADHLGADKITAVRQEAIDLSTSVAKPTDASPKVAKQSSDAVIEALQYRKSENLQGVEKRPEGGIAAVPDAELTPGAASVRNTITSLVDALDATLLQGRVTNPQALGQYNMRQGVARVRNFDDIEVVTHELGHHIDRTIGDPLRAIIRSFEHEMRPLVPQGYDVNAKWEVEGFAEFARLYVTNRPYAERMAPGFAAMFRTEMANINPQVLAALDQAATAHHNFLTAPSGAVARDFVVTWEPPSRYPINEGIRTSIAGRFSDMYTAALDRAHPMTRLTRKLLELEAKNKGITPNLPAELDPSILVRGAMQPYASAAQDFLHGVQGYHSVDRLSMGLKPILVDALGKPNALGKWDDVIAKDFSTYLVGRRAIFEYGRWETGEIPNPPTGRVTLGDWKQILDEMNTQYPQFVRAADNLDKFREEVWKLRFDSGQIDQEQYEAGKLIQHHVPFWRDFSEDPSVAKRMGISLERPAIKRFQGSDRPILDPLQSTVKEVADLRAWIAVNDTSKALRNLAQQAGKGAGRYIEEIPDSELRRMGVNVDDVITAAARSQGLDPQQTAAARAAVQEFMSTETAVNIFSHQPIKQGGEPIIFGWDGGKRFALRINDMENAADVVKMFAQAPAEARDIVLQTIGLGSQIMRAGTTTSIPFVISNIIRDTMMAGILQPDFVPVYHTLKGIYRYLSGHELAQMYEGVGGQIGGAETAALRSLRVTREFQALAQKGSLVSRVSSWQAAWETFAKAAELSETGTRLGVFELRYKRNLKLGADPYSAALRAKHEATDILDFSRHGSRMAQAIFLVPFLNSNMQGVDKLRRATLEPWARAITGQTLTKQDQAALSSSFHIAGKMAMLGVASLALRAMYAGDPEYEEISDYLRSTHWMVKVPWLNGGKVVGVDGRDMEVPAGATGIWLAIPKPYEGAIVANVAERAYESLVMQDSKAMGRWMEGFFGNIAPPNPLIDQTAVKLTAELTLGKSMFTKRDIVPDYLKGLVPQEQYSPHTKEMSKTFANVLNKAWPGKKWSPLEMEHLIFGFTSTWGRDVAGVFDLATDTKDRGMEDLPLTRRFMREVSRGAVSTLAFYDQVSQSAGKLESASRTFKMFTNQGKIPEANDFFAKLNAEQKAYVTLQNGEDFKPDDRRLHPLVRARDAMTEITKMRREIAAGAIITVDRGTVMLTPSQRRFLDDELGLLSMFEARNAMIAARIPGWEHKAPTDVKPTYDVIQGISPEISADLSQRYAQRKVYSAQSVNKNWPEVLQRLTVDGTSATLADMTGSVRSEGFEMGGYRQRKIRAPRIPIGPEMMRVQ